MSDYQSFLQRKDRAFTPCGFESGELSEHLYPFQRDIVRWALRLGRAAIFADCGMGKTPMQLEWAERVAEHTDKDVLILAPLAVAKQTTREAEKFGIEARYCATMADVRPGISVTNYEKLDHFDAGHFGGVVLDESSILKAYDGKTRTAILAAFANTPYRLACTATPAPNDFVELGNHSEFLGVMSRPEMLSMFFIHDGGSTQDWRIKGHAENEYWRWICRWAVMIRKPSDLGYDDGAFVLPPLEIKHRVVAVDHRLAHAAGKLFAMDARTLQERRQARKASVDERVQLCADEVNASTAQWLVWCNLNEEGDKLTAAIDGAVQVAGADDPDTKEQRMVDFAEGRIRVLVSKPSICGFGMNFQRCARMAFVGLSDSFEQFYQAVRRCWRFGQSQAVEAHVITSETEGAVVANIERKEREAIRMAEGMVEHMRSEMVTNIRGTKRDSVGYAPTVEMVIPVWMTSEAS